MSYNVGFTMDTGGSESTMVGDSMNYTSNVSGMWKLALCMPLSKLDGMQATVALPLLEKAVSHIRHPDNRAKYEAMNPDNGWGDHNGAAEVLEWMLAMCRQHPKTKIWMSY